MKCVVSNRAESKRLVTKRAALLFTALLATSLAYSLRASSAAAAPPPAVELARASDLAARFESVGQLAAAARALAPLLLANPDDFALHLRAAWLWFRAEDYTQAERLYRVALLLSDGNLDARLGLAWSLLKRREWLAARQELAVVLGARPGDKSAQEALALARVGALPEVLASFTFATRAEPTHTTRATSYASTLRLGAITMEHFAASAAYRYWSVGLQPAAGSSSSAQHEGYFSLGYTSAAFDLLAHYAVVADKSGVYGTANVAGVSTRIRTFGDLRLELAGSFFDTYDVLRVGGTWSLPLSEGLRFVPGISLQRANGASYAAGSLTLAYETGAFAAWLGGSYGDQLRPAFLVLESASNLAEKSAYSAWLGARFSLPRGFALQAGYELQQLTATTGASSLAHTFSLGFSWSGKP